MFLAILSKYHFLVFFRKKPKKTVFPDFWTFHKYILYMKSPKNQLFQILSKFFYTNLSFKTYINLLKKRYWNIQRSGFRYILLIVAVNALYVCFFNLPVEEKSLNPIIRLAALTTSRIGSFPCSLSHL